MTGHSGLEFDFQLPDFDVGLRVAGDMYRRVGLEDFKLDFKLDIRTRNVLLKVQLDFS